MSVIMMVKTRGQQHRLPPEPNRFVGRRAELDEARRLLKCTRLLTLTGTAGVGKTRLALRLAADVQSRYADGTWLVELAKVFDPDLVASAAAEVFGLGEAGDRTLLEAIAAHVKGQHLLVVLDNGDHVIAGLGHLAGALLAASPGVQVLVTSREALRVSGEQVMVVPPMSVPEPGKAARLGDSYDAVALFVERASAVCPFALTRDTAPAVGRICRYLDGIPLAIELAAAAARALSLAEILERLEDRFALLPRGDRDQQSLRAAIEGSAALCTPAERTLWARLTAFRGGFDLEAAEAICADTTTPPQEILGLLAGLLDKSILIRENTERARVRFRMLATISDYGREMLATSGETATIRARHAGYYRELATRAADDWFGPRQHDWAARMGREHENVGEALEYCATYASGTEMLEFVASLHLTWVAGGGLAEGVRWAERALATHGEPTRARARALHTTAFMAITIGRLDQARRLLTEAEHLATKLEDTTTLAYVALRRGQAALHEGDSRAAAGLLDSALAQHRDLGEDFGTYSALRFRALAAIAQDEPSAGTLAADCLALCTTHEADLSRSWALWVSGMYHRHAGDLQRAATAISDALRIKRSCADLTGTAHCLETLAWIAAERAQTPAEHRHAASLLAASAATWHRAGFDVTGFALLACGHRACEARLREALDADTCRKALADGGDWGTAEAVDAALCSAAPAPPAHTVPTEDESCELTDRELEVAELVAAGMTNQQIAEALFITANTVKAHITNISTKLRLERKTNIAIWFTRRTTK